MEILPTFMRGRTYLAMNTGYGIRARLNSDHMVGIPKKIKLEFGNLLVLRDAHLRHMIVMDETLDGPSRDNIKIYSLQHWKRETIPTRLPH